MNLAASAGLPFRQVVTTGNEIGVTTLDFINYFIDDPHTDLIVCYMEGLRDARRLIEVGKRALLKGKPILAWKVGNTEEGRKAAASHTASLAGSISLYKAAFRQAGIVQVDDIQDLIDVGRAFRCKKLPTGNRMAIVTISGGAGILMTDECIRCGLRVPALAAATTDKLRSFMPSFGSALNPIDVTASVFNDLTLINRTLCAILDDDNVDSIIMINASLAGDIAGRIAAEIVRVARGTDKPIFVCWSATNEDAREAYAKLDEGYIPHYQSPVRCGRALAALSWYAGAERRNKISLDAEVRPTNIPDIRGLFKANNAFMSEYESKKVLAHYAIPVTRAELAIDEEHAVSIAKRINYPVVVKVQSPDIPHKTEAKAVRLDIATDQELLAAYRDVIRNAKAYRSDALIEGVLVEEMVSGGIETIVGITNDKSFGPAIMFGLGGIFSEVLEDITFRIAPIAKSDAIEMIVEIKGYKLLAGARGGRPSDINALADALMKVSRLAIDHMDYISELDINPLFVFTEGKGVKAGDALIRTLPWSTLNRAGVNAVE